MAEADNLSIVEDIEMTAEHKLEIIPEFAAYIRPVNLDDEINDAYAVYNEDGVQLAVFANYDAAFYSAKHNNLNPVSVH